MTTAAAEPRDAIAAELDAEYAGPGWWGSLYRAPQRHRWYRLIPADELTGAQRAELARWQDRPRRPDLVPVVPGSSGDQQQFAGQWFQVVTYETTARRNLADAIAEADPARRAAAAAAAVRALPDWRKSAGPGLVPLPAEIVLAHRPLLLPLPGWGPPSLGQVFAAPERIAHLTPEAARGLLTGDRATDLHALGVAALRCFEALPDEDVEWLIQRAACGAMFSHGPDSRLPAWMHLVEPIRAVVERLAVLTGPAAAEPAQEDPLRLADSLDAAGAAMDPVTAVRALREGEPRRAVRLAHAALRSQPDSYDVLLLAADIARQDLREPLEALSLLDRAVQAEPRRGQAYLAQLAIIAGLPPTARVPGADDHLARRLNQAAHKAFGQLPSSQRRAHAHEMACCLIRHGDDLTEANTFVYHWLHDGDTLMWWSFALMLDYAETFLGLRRFEEATQVADQVREGLRRVREPGHMSRGEIHEHGMRLAAFVRRLHEEQGKEQPHAHD